MKLLADGKTMTPVQFAMFPQSKANKISIELVNGISRLTAQLTFERENKKVAEVCVCSAIPGRDPDASQKNLHSS